MLENYKRIYEDVADSVIPGWRDVSKNDLIIRYNQLITAADAEKTKDIQNAIVAALMSKYWSAIGKYYRTSRSAATAADCHEWLTHAVLYSLRHPVWLKPKTNKRGETKITADGPNQCMNMCIASTRLIFFQAANNNTRKVNFLTHSMEQLKEDQLDYILPTAKEKADACLNNWSYTLVKKKLASNDLFTALVLDGVVNGNAFIEAVETKVINNEVIKLKRDKFDMLQLVKHLKRTDATYCKFFGNYYDVDHEMIERYSLKIKRFSKAVLYDKVSEIFKGLRTELNNSFDVFDLAA